MKHLIYILAIPALFFLSACDKEKVRIINDVEVPTPPNAGGNPGSNAPTSSPVNPVDININTEGFNLLSRVQGHWIGTNLVIADNYQWFAWDYRAISPSHVHGIFEGGTMGNLLTSFFVTDYKGKRTIMARNGGLLNGIYRTTYFVMDSVRQDFDGGVYYRLVDALRGDAVMSIELRFKQDSLYFNAYTSKLGNVLPPTRHMTFKGVNTDLSLAQAAATANNFPQNVVEWDFSNGFNEQNMWIDNGDIQPKSCTFLEYNNDPFKIVDHNYLSYLDITCVRNAQIEGKPLFVYLSKESLTDALGYMQINPFIESVLKFPSIVGTSNEMNYTYLHPGDYFITVIADMNEDGNPGQGDVCNVSVPFTVNPNAQQAVTIDNINVQN